MSSVTIDDLRLDLDIMEVLSEYSWQSANWKPGKLIAASPFRDEIHPSFFVNLTNGAWGDSGAYDENYASGNLAKLLAFLRNETYEETLEYLVDLYGVRELNPGDRIEVPKMRLKKARTRIELDEKVLDPFKYRNPYLRNRGISEAIQRYMGVGYSQGSKAVTLPWRHPDGTLANVKFRQIVGKTFWYAKDAAPIRELIYGIDKIYSRGITTVVVCEAEIDALSWMTCGVPAIALGGTALTRDKLDLIRRSPIERIIKAMDNDGPGGKLSRMLDAGLRGYLAVDTVEIPAPYNDSNEAHVKGVDLRSLL
ncbi:toprim domain-containing protein [Rossellomorea marisflavi]|uniref:toprim domain-containing protein n=1 Tax=Rossellomorea marisflavi TaxID=189381 RepID=UPI0009A90E07|nr:toprim domain-containing protein [Rossellomorea marisflavi]